MHKFLGVLSCWQKFACGFLIIALAALTGCSDSSTKRFMFLTNGDDPFWDTCRAGMTSAAAELKIEEAGFSHAMDKGSEFDVAKQIAKLEQYASQTDIAGVAISPVDAGNKRLAAAMENLRKKGVAVICVDSDMDREKFRASRFAYLGTDNAVGGQELGKAAKSLLPEGGDYATFVGIKTVQNAIDRIGGFAQGAGDKFENVDGKGGAKADEGDRNRAQENVKAVIDKHSDIDALVGIWSYNAHAIAKVVEDRGMAGKVKVICFDAAKQALEDMEAGKIDVLIVQNPYQMGELTIKLLKALNENDGETIKSIYPSYDSAAGTFGDADGDILDTELRVVVPDESSPVRPELFGEGTKFFYFKDFKKWLDERKLNNS